jgi:uncharacterized membrane protein YqjE
MKIEKEIPSLVILNLLRIFRSASKAILAQVNLHQQLVKVEWEEEKKRLSQLFLACLFGFACLICLLFFLGFLVVALSWDTQYRAVSILVLCGVYGLGLYISWNRFARLAKSPEGFFSNTREELAADFSMIKSKIQ